jgi:hypothetical protein
VVAGGEGRLAGGGGPGSPPLSHPSTASTAPSNREGGAAPGRRTTRPSAPPTGRQHATAHHSPADRTSAEPAGLTSDTPRAGCSRVCRGRRQQCQTYWVLPPRPIVFAVRTCAPAHPACPMSYRPVSDNESGERSPRSGARRSPAAACWPASRRQPGPARSPRCNRPTRGDAAERPPLARRGSDGRTRS